MGEVPFVYLGISSGEVINSMPEESTQSVLPGSALAARFGVTNDYISQLCRANKIEGRLIGRVWYVSEKSLKEYLEGKRQVQEQKNNSMALL